MSKKFPRISHLPYSPGGTNDDETRLKSVEHFINKEIVITEKVDGSNICFTCEEVFARTHSVKATHKSFDAAKAIHAKIKNNIDDGISIFGEWCFAVHSIEYSRLPNYFLIFGIRDDNLNIFWKWDKTVDYAQNKLFFPVVKQLFRGMVNDEVELKNIVSKFAIQKSEYGEDKREGIVVRLTDEISDFNISIAKWVRENHIKNPDEHWMIKPIKKQGII